MNPTTDLPIRVDHPRRLGTWTIEAERLDLGEGYKPSLALLPGGDLVLVSLDNKGDAEAGTWSETMPLRRSLDGGRTWTEPEVADDVIGREQWLTCTSAGVLFSSSHILERDARNEDGSIHSYLHRSTDGGRTWERTKLLLTGEARRGEPEEKWTHTSRNVALDGAELILSGCASPARGYSRSSPLPANLAEWDRIAARTATEHGIFLLLAHLSGSEGGKLFAGGSTAWGPDGALLARGPLFADGRTIVTVDIGEILRARQESPFLADLSTALPRLRASLDRAWSGDGPPWSRAGQGSDTDPDGRRTSDARLAAPSRKAETGPARPRPTSPTAPQPTRPDAADRETIDIDPKLVELALVEFIRDEVTRRRGFERVVIGVSGGVDSAVSLLLACKALGPANVHGFRLPYATSSADSLAHAKIAIAAAGAREHTVSITAAVDAYVSEHEPDVTPTRRGNLAARMRSAILFDQSAKLDALPLGTGNKSERLLGYYTWHGDDSPPINPLGDLFKTQVWTLARHLGVPAEIVDKPASADLIRGVHDEDELGISYHRADPILHHLLKGHDPASLARLGFCGTEVAIVWKRLSSTHWKRRLPTVALLSDTAIGESYLRPVDY